MLEVAISVCPQSWFSVSQRYWRTTNWIAFDNVTFNTSLDSNTPLPLPPCVRRVRKTLWCWGEIATQVKILCAMGYGEGGLMLAGGRGGISTALAVFTSESHMHPSSLVCPLHPPKVSEYALAGRYTRGLGIRGSLPLHSLNSFTFMRLAANHRWLLTIVLLMAEVWSTLSAMNMCKNWLLVVVLLNCRFQLLHQFTWYFSFLLSHAISTFLSFSLIPAFSILMGEDIKGKPAAEHTKYMINGGGIQNNNNKYYNVFIPDNKYSIWDIYPLIRSGNLQ